MNVGRTPPDREEVSLRDARRPTPGVGAIRLWYDTIPVAEIRTAGQPSPATGSLTWQVPAHLPPGEYYLVQAILNRGSPPNLVEIAEARSPPFRLQQP